MRIAITEKEIFKNLLNEMFNTNIKIINSFCIDSRKIQKDDIFLAIKGKKSDGHDYIEDAIDANASIIFSEKKHKNKNIINVRSTKEVLKKIAVKWINLFNKPIIAITGSSGKTTTKEMVNTIFSSHYKTNCTKDNYNSSIGLPINLFNFSFDADIIILEMGANQPNEINNLCNIVKPTYSIITNIQNAHIGNFKSINELIETKSAIFNNKKDRGYIFENSDDKNILKVSKNIKNKISFGFNNKNVDFFGLIKYKNAKINFYINDKEIFNQNLNQIMAKNMLVAYSVASTYGIKHQIIVKELQKFNFISGRGNQIIKNDLLLIDDTYNASLESFIIGVDSFLAMESKGNKILVIGDMNELGTKNDEFHYKLGKHINQKLPNIVLALGVSIKKTISKISNKKIYAKHFDTKKLLLDKLKNTAKKGDAIYFKASRSMNFEKIINQL
tara:strand:- start:42 stop:1373 length:1332 start_codon:yes stop_codon:yes gene_type:complete